jgi:predicted anti-sigma-YlaC factor YlaD
VRCSGHDSTPGALLAYPEVEAAVWPLLQAGFTGALPVSEALATAARAMDAVIGDRTARSAIS